MDTRIPRIGVEAALAGLVAECRAAGPDAVLSLACDLEKAANALRKERDGMVATFDCGCCSDCGKRFAVRITVERERKNGLPENCPPCFDASSSGKKSGKKSSL